MFFVTLYARQSSYPYMLYVQRVLLQTVTCVEVVSASVLNAVMDTI